MFFTLENLRLKWLPTLKKQVPTQLELFEYQEDLKLYKAFNPNGSWRKININKLK